MRIGYLGPEGTFSHEVAAGAARPDDVLVALATNRDVVIAVQDGRVERSVAPVENMIDGAVTAVLDALAFDAPDVRIVGEAVAVIHHVLVAAEPLELAEVTSVASHPVALGQCGVFLRGSLPQAELIAATSTAEAVRSLAGGTAGAAAIGTAAAARQYGATVLVAGIEDDPDNRTRFVWLTRAGNALAPVDAGMGVKTSVLFHGAGDGRPGWLLRCLGEFADRDVNLTKIESRPLRSALGHYIFHVDCDGAAGSNHVDDAIAALRTHCEHVRVLGTYAAAPATIPSGHGGSNTT